MNLSAVKRYSRQIALPELGLPGQERLLAAEIVLAGVDAISATAGLYLAGAGISRFRMLERRPGEAATLAGALDHAQPEARIQPLPWPETPAAWLAALRGAQVALRAGYDDDPMLRAAVSLGVPLVVVRALPAGIDLIGFRRHGPCPHLALEVPARRSEHGGAGGARDVLAGTLAATEVLWILAAPGDGPRARHLRLASEGEPVAQELPWSPECFLCGGRATDLVLP